MKNTLAILLILILIVPLFGCGKKDEAEGPVSIHGKAPTFDNKTQGSAQGMPSQEAK